MKGLPGLGLLEESPPWSLCIPHSSYLIPSSLRAEHMNAVVLKVSAGHSLPATEVIMAVAIAFNCL